MYLYSYVSSGHLKKIFGFSAKYEGQNVFFIHSFISKFRLQRGARDFQTPCVCLQAHVTMASSVESQDVSITSSPARNTITKLQARLDQKEQDLQLAATFGKQLLEANNELNQQLEATCTQMAAKLEVRHNL